MPLADALGSNNDIIDPGALSEQLFRQRNPSIVAPNEPIDPELVASRMLRKHLQQPPPEDFTKFGVAGGMPKPEMPPPEDFAKFGVAGGVPKPAEAAPTTIGNTLSALGQGETWGTLGKSTAESAAKSTGEIAKALTAAPTPEDTAKHQKLYGLYDKFTKMTPAEQESLTASLGGKLTKPAVVDGQTLSGAERSELLRHIQRFKEGHGVKSFEEFAEPTLKRASEALEKASTAIAPTEEEKARHPIATGTGAAIGGTIPGALAMTAGTLAGGPVGGMAVGGSVFGLQSYQSAYDNAIKQGASPEVAQKVGTSSGIVGGVIALLPIGVAGKFAERTAPGVIPWLQAKAAQMGAGGLTFGAVGEFQAAMDAEIAKKYGVPGTKDYSPDAARIASSMIAGAVLGFAHPTSAHVNSEEFLRRMGEAPQPPPGEAPPSQTRADIDEFLRQQEAREAAKRPRLTGPRTEAPTEEEPPEAPPRPAGPMTKAQEDAALREYGFTDEDIAAWRPKRRAAELARVLAAGTRTGEEPPPEVKPVVTPPEAKPPEAPPETPPPAAVVTPPPPKATPPTPQTPEGAMAGLANMFGQEPAKPAPAKPAIDLTGMGKAIGDNLRNHLWDRVQAGAVNETSNSGPSAVLQAAKMVRAAGGLQTREEFDRFLNDTANVTPESPTFQQDMMKVVRDHMPDETEHTHRAAIDKFAAANNFHNLDEGVRAVAAELHAKEGYTPEDAVRIAGARKAVADGTLTPEQVRKDYGEEKGAIILGAGAKAPIQLPAPAPSAGIGRPATAPQEGEGQSGTQVQTAEGKPAGSQAAGGERGKPVGEAAGTAGTPSGGTTPGYTPSGERTATAVEGRPRREGGAAEPEAAGGKAARPAEPAEIVEPEIPDNITGAKRYLLRRQSITDPEKLKPVDAKAAIKIDGKVFAGTTHADAYEKAIKAGITEAHIDAADPRDLDGWVTPSGKFVHRWEDAAAKALDATLANNKLEIPPQVRTEAIKDIRDGETPLEAIKDAVLTIEHEEGLVTPEELADNGAKEKPGEVHEPITPAAPQPGETAAEEGAKPAAAQASTGAQASGGTHGVGESEGSKPSAAGEPAGATGGTSTSGAAKLTEPAKPVEPATEPGAKSLADRFAEHLGAGEGFAGILQARKFAKDAGFSEDPKTVEEALELAVVKTARGIVHGDGTLAEKYASLVDLYRRQPTLGTRTSTSMRDQAFSTPVPLAYIASRLADITPKTSVFEPTAGNGALLIEANPKLTIANEINPDRAKNLQGQGFKTSQQDATAPSIVPAPVDRVVANPPFGAVREAQTSKVFDLSDIQRGYSTHEIDHAIALRALEDMKGDGKAVLIIGSVNKLAASPEARSDAYNSKAKREFFKTLYDRYNVVDHFTVNGDLYAKQGAGWPVDVISIDGRGKSARRLPAVDPPRIIDTWEALGGLINESAQHDAGAVGRPAGEAVAGTPPGGPEPADGGVRAPGRRGGVPSGITPEGIPETVRAGSPPDKPGNYPADQAGHGAEVATGGDVRVTGGTGSEPAAERRPPGVDIDKAFDDALDSVFGAAPEATPEAKVPAEPRTTKEVAKSAVKNALESSDAAMKGLTELFGGGKTFGAGPAFDEETYAKAKPMFEKAAEKFAAFAHDVAELMRRMVAEMQRVYGLTREAFERMRPYVKRFMEDVQRGEVKLGGKEVEKPPVKAPVRMEKETEGQVAYTPKSKSGNALGTLSPVNLKKPVADALDALETRVGNVDNFVAVELGMPVEALPKYFAQEQVDAIALALDNIKRGKGAVVGDQTGIGKGRSQPLSANILTPRGWVRMGTLIVGSEIIAADGKPAKVAAIFPQGELDVYQINFSDGSSTECSVDHLWVTQHRQSRSYAKHKPKSIYGRYRVLTTEQLMEPGALKRAYSIPLVNPVMFHGEPPLIDPYFLGVALGDGSIRKGSVTLVLAETEMQNLVRSVLPAGIELKKVPSRDYHYYVVKTSGRYGIKNNPIIRAMRAYGIIGAVALNKYIPSEVKIGPIGSRLSVLQGLMDTDGECGKNGACVFNTISAQLADDVIFIVRSLGGIATRSIKVAMLNGKRYNDCHRVYIKLPAGVNPFRLTRKAERVRTSWVKYPPARYIKSITHVGRKQCQCIAIDHPSKLYVTDDFIVTHNTNAAIIRWSIHNGRIPIFVTEKPNLYKDINRDLTETGLGDFLGRDPKFLMTNANLEVPMTDEGDKSLRTGEAKDHNALLGSLPSDPKEFLKQYDVVLTNYSQMQTLAGEDTARRNFLRNIIGNSVLILDESHNAGGQKKTRVDKRKPVDRAGYARELVQQANGVFYSSATYAKRPDVMDLYAATDMSMAVADPKDLGEAIAKGGVPMQQAVAAMLAKAGQYVRRERSFDGVNYNTPSVEVDRDTYDGVSRSLKAILDFSSAVKKLAKDLDQTIKAQAEAVYGDMSVGDVGAKSITFTSVMHNLINQYLLAVKAKPAAALAIEALKRGEKPVLTVANTMESFLNDFADDMNIKHGDAIGAHFGDVLKKYLDRSRTLIIKKPFAKKGETIRKYLTDAELGPAGKKLYDAVKKQIDDLDLSEIPVSPIDVLKNELAKAGYKVGEITGRGNVIDYSGPNPIYKPRPGRETSIKGRANTIMQFNKGEFDALIMNQAGSTGISLHASEKFADQRKRHMYIVQPEANIDTHMQLLGRIHRTGQVVLPEYTQMVAGIPAEKRPAAVLAKKMASLNANTTGARGSAVTAKDVPDFMNQYGDVVAGNMIAEDPALNQRLGEAIKFKDNGSLDTTDAMRKVTGRIPLLPLKEQEAMYAHLEDEYKAYLEQKNAAGENALEAQTLPLEAKTLKATEVVPQKAESGTSPFAAPVNVEKVSVKRLGKPMTSPQIIAKIYDSVGLKVENVTKEETAGHLEDMSDPRKVGAKAITKAQTEQAKKALGDFDSYKRSIIDELDTPERQEAERVKLDAVRDRWQEMQTMLRPGARVTLKLSSGNLAGIVLKVEQKGKPKNPLALSTWKATVAIADAQKQITYGFSRLWPDGRADPEDAEAVEVQPVSDWLENHQQTLDRFDSQQSEGREERHIATGNMLAAYDYLDHKGRIINYTDSEGNIHQGILTPRGWDLAEHARDKKTILQSPNDVVNWMRDHPGETISTTDGVVVMQSSGPYNATISVQAAKRVGGMYFLDRELTDITGDFVKRGNQMAAQRVPIGQMAEAVKRLQALGAKFEAANETPIASRAPIAEAAQPVPEKPTVVVARKEPPPLRPELRLTQHAKAALPRIQKAITEMVRHMLGDKQAIEFLENVETPPESVGWGEGNKSRETLATYDTGNKLISMALDADISNLRRFGTAAHEIYHAVEDRFATDEEINLVKRQKEQMQANVIERVSREYADRWNLPDKEARRTIEPFIKGISDYELRAENFRLFMQDKIEEQTHAGEGMHIGLRRLYERFWNLIQRIRNLLSGHGFHTAEDFYEDIRAGKMKERPGTGSRLADEIHADQEARRAAASKAPPVLRATQPPPPRRPTGPPLNQAATLRQRWSVRIRNQAYGSDDIIFNLQDRHVWKRRVGEMYERMFQGVEPTYRTPDAENIYAKARLYHGRVENEIGDFHKTHADPLFDAMKAAKLTTEQVGKYLYARHAAERNAEMERINPDIGDAGSGMSNEEAAEIIQAAHSGPQAAAYRDIHRRVQAIRNDILSRMERSGLETPETIRIWREKYADYVDLRGVEDIGDDQIAREDRPSGRFNVRGREIRPAYGRLTKANNPLFNMMDQAHRTIERAERNYYLHSVWNATRSFTDEFPAEARQFVKMDRVPMKREIDPATGLVRFVPDNSFRYKEEAVHLKIRGVPHYMVFTDPKIADGLKTISPYIMHPVMMWWLRMINHIKGLWTHLSAPFLVRHFGVRYPIEAAANSVQLKDTGEHSVLRGFMDAYPYLGAASKAIFASHKGITHADPRVAEYQRYWEEMRKAGGAQNFNMRDVERALIHYERRIKDLSGKPLAQSMHGARALLEGIDIATNALTNAEGLASYAAARRQGQSVQKAAMVARQASVDFSLGGYLRHVIGIGVPFGNVAVQTGARMNTALRTSHRMRNLFGAFILGGFLSGMYNYLVGGEDADGIPFFDKIAPWDRRQNFIIMNPFHRDEKGRPVPYKLIMPYNWGVPQFLGSALAQLMFTKHPRGEIFKQLAHSAMELFLPLQENWKTAFVPEPLKLLFELGINRDAFDRPIHNDMYQHGPAAYSGRKDTGEGWKLGAQGINMATGGSARKSGVLDPYPETLRYAVLHFFEAQYRPFEEMARTGKSIAEGETPKAAHIPIVKQFMGADYDQADKADKARKKYNQKHPWLQ